MKFIKIYEEFNLDPNDKYESIRLTDNECRYFSIRGNFIIDEKLYSMNYQKLEKLKDGWYILKGKYKCSTMQDVIKLSAELLIEDTKILKDLFTHTERFEMDGKIYFKLTSLPGYNIDEFFKTQAHTLNESVEDVIGKIVIEITKYNEIMVRGDLSYLYFNKLNSYNEIFDAFFFDVFSEVFEIDIENPRLIPTTTAINRKWDEKLNNMP